MSIRNHSQGSETGDFFPDDDLRGNGGLIRSETTDSFSVIDRFSTFDGTFHSSRDLRIEGEAKGTIECQGTLMVAQGATVTAKVEAEHVTVAGDLNGDIRCRGRLQIMPSGRVRGKVVTETLVINEGAFYEGQLEMATTSSDPRPVGRTPRPLAQIAASTPPPAPVANPAPAGATESEARGARGTDPNNPSTFIRRFGGPETPWTGGDEEGGSDERPDE